MNYRVIISPNASRNIDDAVEYYKENVSKKVALGFLADFQNTYKALQRNPF
jgi:toxin ParE1/3/4